MSPTKIAVKRAARFNLYVLGVAAVFSLWAIAKAQTADAPVQVRVPVAAEALHR